ncbi:glycosyltransferase family 2 protein [Saccharolobus islandicus]|uniref:Glycosyl transferase, family 2 n=1 Tax=Saccharolobus islandicus (strain L.D.8.5 / Lassen \|nr:glycosyltransferase family A protein [Sulfolobus islandicus]ADB86543.1 glycosyl transferase, family 2 [Sulfolobus islandicus L.D.8.5]
MNYFIYATVFNNVSTLDESVKSVWRSDSIIVITDNYSTDGTWERLQGLKKDYNLILYRLKSTRGKGRDYSLKHCPENSITTYFDSDMRYNESFHKILEWAPRDKRTLVNLVNGFVVKRETILEKGSWRNLNRAEDWEIVSRVGFDYFIPALTHAELRNELDRERRYAKGLKYYARRFKNKLDVIRGLGYNWSDMNIVYSKHSTPYKIFINAPSYILAKLMGIYRNYREYNNGVGTILSALDKMIDLKEIGVNDKYFLFGGYWGFFSAYNLDKIIDEKLPSKVGRVRKFICNDNGLRYVKTLEEFDIIKLASSLKDKLECNEFNP